MELIACCQIQSIFIKLGVVVVTATMQARGSLESRLCNKLRPHLKPLPKKKKENFYI
jgi:hypothetical protein